VEKKMVSYRITPETGALTKIGEYPTGDGPNWIHLVRLP
jgi:6-phosphogluconolactonase (cycloisomerase 2 family)